MLVGYQQLLISKLTNKTCISFSNLNDTACMAVLDVLTKGQMILVAVQMGSHSHLPLLQTSNIITRSVSFFNCEDTHVIEFTPFQVVVPS